MISHNTISTESRSKPIQCLLRAMSIMEFISDKDGIGVSEIAANMKLHVATTHNILRTLCLGGFLVNLKGRYHIGPAAGRLSFSWSPLQILPSLASDPMNRMSKNTGETGFIGVNIGDDSILMPLSSGNNEITVHPRKHRFDSPLAVASGRLLVAVGPKNKWQHFVDLHLNSGRPGTTKRLIQELENISSQGFSILRRPRADGTDVVACPIIGPDGKALAALAVVFPNFRATPEHVTKMIKAVNQAAIETSSAIGGNLAEVTDEIIEVAIAKSFSRETSCLG